MALHPHARTYTFEPERCGIESAEYAASVQREVGRVDMLATQFSYASWQGNPDEEHRRRQRAAVVLSTVLQQVEALKPRWVIPFASFVWFCHEENFFMNEGMNLIGDVAGRIAETPATPVVMYPGDPGRSGAVRLRSGSRAMRRISVRSRRAARARAVQRGRTGRVAHAELAGNSSKVFKEYRCAAGQIPRDVLESGEIRIAVADSGLRTQLLAPWRIAHGADGAGPTCSSPITIRAIPSA